MSEIKIITHFDGFLEIKNLLYDSTGVIAMSSMVDIATFHHHEEFFMSVLFIKMSEASFGHDREGQHTRY